MSATRLLAGALAVGALAAPAAALAPPQRVLADRMVAAGLDRVEPVDLAGPAVRGSLVGEGELTVLLFAGCGPGAEASRDAALLATADLARTPRRHTLEVVACAGGGTEPETATFGAEAWLARQPGTAARDAVLAALHLEPGEAGGSGGAGLLLAAADARRRLPPAWLAHAVLTGGRAGGAGLAIGDLRWPLMGQLLGRHARSRAGSGAEPFLAAGVPALTLAGGGPEAGWPAALAGVVRRLDSLAGRPRDDDVYLALGGRVWSRRDLYWAGLAAWVALIAGGLPGAWRGAGGRQRRRRGRRYLPGFVFRMLFLVALLTEPVATLVLLAPAALLTPLPLGRPAAVRVGRVLAAVPAALFAGSWGLALFAGRVGLWPAQPARLALVIGGVVLAVWLVGRRQVDETAAVG